MYRSEIDGLRAVSVLLILLYHLEVSGFYGGFVGVDIFFVISGFLISGLILDDLDRQQFSFGEFYKRRVARILPALFATILITLLVAIVVLPPLALVHTAKQSLAAIFSVSNVFFWLESSYWAPAARNSLLLHTWSLGVEEQFYLFYPILLVLCYRVAGRRGAFLLLASTFVLGLGASEWVVRSSPSAAYFLTPLRLFEFALGGLGSLLVGQLPMKAPFGKLLTSMGTVLGLGLIVYSARMLTAFHWFPGLYALLPTLGALMVILCGASPAGSMLLGNPVMVWLGRLSFSLYLVHWPLIVFHRTLLGPELSTSDKLVLLGTALVAAMLLNRWVEQRFRLSRTSEQASSPLGTTKTMQRIGVAAGITAFLAVAVIQGDGWISRLPESARRFATVNDLVEVRNIRAYVANHCSPRGEPFCGERLSDRPNVMLLADSRGPEIYLALHTAFPQLNILASYADGCAPVFNPAIGRSVFFSECPELNRRRLEAALRAPVGDVVFLAMNFDSWRASFVVETAKQLAQSGKRVFVLGESRFLRGKSPTEIVIDMERYSAGDDYIERFLVASPFALDATAGAEINAAGAFYVSNKSFFQQSNYRLFTRDGSDLLSYDGVHLTAAGAREFGTYLAENYPLD
ncbi:MAG: peptidoglycan/LPS O-acetylase OafA/YrhL [Halieaceae bacterium]|jgi:peptidoglycan/LPS O-acetylase OafA/YrhL